MRWWMWALVAVVVVTVVSVVVVALLPKNPNVGDRGKLAATFTASEQHTLDTVTISRAELAEATCEDGRRCLVAVNGVVYDLGGLDGWKRGRHHGVVAGTDATEQFVRSAHGAAKLDGVPVVGRLVG